MEIELRKKRSLRQQMSSSGFRVVVMIVLLYLVSGVMMPSYFAPSHIMQVLVLACFLGIICIGQTFIIISGGTDLSVAYSVTLAACVFAQLTKQTGNGILGFVAAILVSILFGAFKGVGVAVLGIPSMVMTLATNAILMSTTYLFTGGVLKGNATDFVTTLAKGSIFGIRWCVLVWLVLGLIAIFILRKTTFGRAVYAIGSNARVAQLSGINVVGVTIGIYIYATVMMAIAGVLLVGYLGYPNYTMADGYQLISIAAVVIGGTSILGGKGSYLGTMGGVVIIYLIQSILTILKIADAGKDIVNGLVILLILFAYDRNAKMRV